MMPISRPALRYFGGKWRIADWIISYFPQHYSYVEPFCGASSVLLRKPAAPIETINDMDNDVVNFFRVLRENYAEFARVIELTPYSRAELATAYQPTNDPLERARRLYIRSGQAFGGQRKQGGGWRFSRNSRRGQSHIEDFRKIDHLRAIVDRLKYVQIENDDALRVIDRYDAVGTLFYVDPPYVTSARSDKWHVGYAYEYNDADHRILADKLRRCSAMVVLSGYETDMYAELYSGWKMVSRKSRTLNQGWAVECLWLNDAASSAARQKDLFQEAIHAANT